MLHVPPFTTWIGYFTLCYNPGLDVVPSCGNLPRFWNEFGFYHVLFEVLEEKVFRTGILLGDIEDDNMGTA